MGSPYFATHGYASPLTPAIQGSHPDLPGQRATGLHQDNQRLAGLPSCVTPSLAYYRIGSHSSSSHLSQRFHALLWNLNNTISQWFTPHNTPDYHCIFPASRLVPL